MADRALTRPGTVLRVSPIASAPTLATADAWVVVQVQQASGEWRLVRLADGSRGWVPFTQVAVLSGLD
jgi:SH3-like domain-containing protein